jgi:hypothetical protein
MRTFKFRSTLRSVTLTRKTLVELEQIVRDAIPNGRIDFSISTSLRDSEINEESVRLLLDHPDLPRVLTDVSFWMRSYEGDDQRQISLYMHHDYISLNTESTEEEWARGKLERIKAYLRQSRNPLSSMLVSIRTLLAVLPFVLGYTAGMAASRGILFLSVTAGMGAVGAAATFALAAMGRVPVLSSTRVRLADSSALSVTTAMLVLTAVAAGAAVLQVVLLLVSMAQSNP